MAISNQVLKISWIGENEVETIELSNTLLEEHNYIINNEFDCSQARTYLDDTPYKFWARPRDIRA